jgi:hypothetical protein
VACRSFELRYQLEIGLAMGERGENFDFHWDSFA